MWNDWSRWNIDPLLLLGLALAAWGYSQGMLNVWQRAGANHGIRIWQAACFAGGLVALFLALISPLDTLSAALFSMHMTQHLVLIVVAAPLLVLGNPAIALLWTLPLPARRMVGKAAQGRLPQAVWGVLSLPLVVWLLHTAAIWLWHAPVFYQAALANNAIHAVEHGCFLGTALLFWWEAIHPRGGRGHYGLSILLLFTTAVQSGMLGALLTFSAQPWYAAYTTSQSWGLSALEDQQLAGLIMWIPTSVIYLAAIAVLFVFWLRAIEIRSQRRERVSRAQQSEQLLPLVKEG